MEQNFQQQRPQDDNNEGNTVPDNKGIQKLPNDNEGGFYPPIENPSVPPTDGADERDASGTYQASMPEQGMEPGIAGEEITPTEQTQPEEPQGIITTPPKRPRRRKRPAAKTAARARAPRASAKAKTRGRSSKKRGAKRGRKPARSARASSRGAPARRGKSARGRK